MHPSILPKTTHILKGHVFPYNSYSLFLQPYVGLTICHPSATQTHSHSSLPFSTSPPISKFFQDRCPLLCETSALSFLYMYTSVAELNTYWYSFGTMLYSFLLSLRPIILLCTQWMPGKYLLDEALNKRGRGHMDTKGCHFRWCHVCTAIFIGLWHWYQLGSFNKETTKSTNPWSLLAVTPRLLCEALHFQ